MLCSEVYRLLRELLESQLLWERFPAPVFGLGIVLRNQPKTIFYWLFTHFHRRVFHDYILKMVNYVNVLHIKLSRSSRPSVGRDLGHYMMFQTY